MEKKQFRIGNLIFINAFGVEIPAIIENGKDIDLIGKYGSRPIPLTESWLEKFGFFQDAKNDVELNFHYPDSDYMCRINGFYILLREQSDIEINISYVHQLQNVFFALTGTELTLKKYINEK